MFCQILFQIAFCHPKESREREQRLKINRGEAEREAIILAHEIFGKKKSAFCCTVQLLHCEVPFIKMIAICTCESSEQIELESSDCSVQILKQI